jgi:hypothetical protein
MHTIYIYRLQYCIVRKLQSNTSPITCSPNILFYILYVDDLHFFHIACFMYKVFNGISCELINSNFKLFSMTHTYHTRLANFNFVLPHCNTMSKKCFVTNHACVIWNNLSIYIRTFTSLFLFKKTTERFNF